MPPVVDVIAPLVCFDAADCEEGGLCDGTTKVATSANEAANETQ